MDVVRKLKLSALAQAVCMFLAAGLCWDLWRRPSAGFENSYVLLGAIIFLALGIVSLVFLRWSE